MKDNKTKPRGCESAKVQSVIVTKSLRGQGTDDNPVRIVT